MSSRCVALAPGPPPQLCFQYASSQAPGTDGEPSVLLESADAESLRWRGQGHRKLRRHQDVPGGQLGFQDRRRLRHPRRVTPSYPSKPLVLLSSEVLCLLDVTRNSSRVLLAGFEAPNLRKVADRVASFGYLVVAPDFVHGDPYAPENAERPISMWIKDHAPGNLFEQAKPVIATLKEKGVSSIGAAGYCWGAKAVVELAKAHYIQAAVISHPSFVTVDDMKEVKCPIAILGAGNDKLTLPELIKQFDQVLSSNSEIGHFVKIFRGVDHGWTLRYHNGDLAAVKSAEEAMDMTDWFKKNLN